MSNSGEASEIRIFLRDGRLAGRFLTPARPMALAG
jgi:hypothetical protein